MICTSDLINAPILKLNDIMTGLFLREMII